MKVMKKLFIMILALTMVVSLALPSVYAQATDDLSVENFSLVIAETGDTLTVALNCSKAVTAYGSGSGVMSIQNSNDEDAKQYFTLSSITKGLLTDLTSSTNNASWGSSATDYENGDTMVSGDWVTYTYILSDTIPEDEYTFVMTFGDDCNDVNFELYSIAEQSITGTYTVGGSTEPSAPAADYTVGITADKTQINVDDTVTVFINVDGSAGFFATSQIKISYDPTYLTFDAENENHVLNGAGISVSNGVITLVDHGAAQNNGVAYELVFTGKAVTTEDSVVTLTSAAFDKAENAPVQNIQEIELDEATNKVNVSVVEERFTVELSDDFDTADGLTVVSGGTFTFYAKDTNYTYTVSVNGGDITPTYDEATGVWTIINVQADLTITATKEAKTFDVTIDSTDHVESNDGVGENVATYKEDYTFTLKADGDDYQYNLVSITIGGEAAPANSYSNDGKVYTIKGDFITGDIVITTQAVEIEEFTITGVGGVLAATATTVKDGEEVTLTLTPVTGYKYEITINGTPISLDNNNQYTAAVTEDWAVVVTETLDLSEENVSIGDNDSVTYLNLDGKTVYMIQITTELDEGNVYAYNGTNMFWSEKYNNNNGAYVFLVVVDNSAQALTLDEIIANITITQGAAKSIDYSGNVNMADANTVDANDAQLVYNMYETKSYDGFVTNVEMEKYLRADVNGDGEVNTFDAVAIVNSILSAN